MVVDRISVTREIDSLIDQQIHTIVDLTTRRARVSFTRLLQRAKTRVEVIVTFLAVLELIKRRQINAQQDGLFGEIVLTRRADTPSAPEPGSAEPDFDYTTE